MGDPGRQTSDGFELLRQSQLDGHALALLHLVVQLVLQFPLPAFLGEAGGNVSPDPQIVTDSGAVHVDRRHMHADRESRAVPAARHQLDTELLPLAHHRADLLECRTAAVCANQHQRILAAQLGCGVAMTLANCTVDVGYPPG